MENRKRKAAIKTPDDKSYPAINPNKPLLAKQPPIRTKILPSKTQLISSFQHLTLSNDDKVVVAPHIVVSPLVDPTSLLGADFKENQDIDFFGMVTLKIPENAMEQVTRKPIHLWFNLDRSGSMKGEKLSLAKKAIAALIENENLQDSDRITFRAFDDKVDEESKICTYLEVAAFRNENHPARQYFNHLESGGCTFIGASFKSFLESETIQAIPQEEKERFQLIAVTLTDGICDYPETTNKLFNEVKETHQGIISYGIGFGEDYIPKAVGEFNHQVPLEAPIHIEGEGDIYRKFDVLNDMMQPGIPISSLTLTFRGETIPLSGITQIKPGEEYTTYFKIKKSAFQGESPITINCEFSGIGFQYQVPALINPERNYELLALHANQRAKEILDLTDGGTELHTLLAKFSVPVSRTIRIFELYPKMPEAMSTVYDYIVELRQLYELLSGQPDENLIPTLNALNELLCYLSGLFFAPLKFYISKTEDLNLTMLIHKEKLTWYPNFSQTDTATSAKKLCSGKVGSAAATSNRAINTFNMSGLSKRSHYQYMGVDPGRSAAQEQRFQRLQEAGQFKKTNNGWFVRINYQSFAVINRKRDFSQLPSLLAQNAFSGLLALDGSLDKGEGILLDGDSYEAIENHIKKHFKDSLASSGNHLINHLIESMKQNLPLAETPEDKLLLALTTFNIDTGLKVKLESGREIPCVPLNRFPIGNCRHLTLYLAVMMGIMIQKGLLAPGPVHCFRYVAYNNLAAHMWLMYQPSQQELYLIDPTLPGNKQFNLKTPEGLIAAIEAYNAIGLNGLLADVIKYYGLKDLIDEETYNKLFDVEFINLAVVEQFDEDRDFDFARSYLSKKVASKPVRIQLETANGEIEVAEEIYDEAEIKEYIHVQENNIFYPDADAFDPVGSPRKIVDMMPADDVKQKLLALIVEKNIVANPEEFSGNLMQLESVKRGESRLNSVHQRAKEILKMRHEQGLPKKFKSDMDIEISAETTDEHDLRSHFIMFKPVSMELSATPLGENENEIKIIL